MTPLQFISNIKLVRYMYFLYDIYYLFATHKVCVIYSVFIASHMACIAPVLYNLSKVVHCLVRSNLSFKSHTLQRAPDLFLICLHTARYSII